MIIIRQKIDSFFVMQNYNFFLAEHYCVTTFLFVYFFNGWQWKMKVEGKPINQMVFAGSSHFFLLLAIVWFLLKLQLLNLYPTPQCTWQFYFNFSNSWERSDGNFFISVVAPLLLSLSLSLSQFMISVISIKTPKTISIPSGALIFILLQRNSIFARLLLPICTPVSPIYIF